MIKSMDYGEGLILLLVFGTFWQSKFNITPFYSERYRLIFPDNSEC